MAEPRDQDLKSAVSSQQVENDDSPVQKRAGRSLGKGLGLPESLDLTQSASDRGIGLSQSLAAEDGDGEQHEGRGAGLDEPIPEPSDSEATGLGSQAGNHSAVEQRTRLFAHGQVKVFAAEVGADLRPWDLAVNALVIPVGVRGGMYGSLATALQRELGEQLWSLLRDLLRDGLGSEFGPRNPAYIPLTDPSLGAALLPNAPAVHSGGVDAGGPPYQYGLIAATVANEEKVDAISPIAAAIVRCAVSNGVRRLALPLLGTGRGPLRDDGGAVAQRMVRGVYETLLTQTAGELLEITLSSRDTVAVEAMRDQANLLTNNLGQSFRNDQPVGPDLLGIQAEVGALTETLLLQDVEPPLAVGILGGWGTGKSFVMNLMRRRMVEIRARSSPGWPEDGDGQPAMPFVGHIYQIDFNAWTYAKSNLWASLMQKIFFELNRQLTLEHELARVLARRRVADIGTPTAADLEAAKRDVLLEEGSLWEILYVLDDDERKALLDSLLSRENDLPLGEISVDMLWQRLQEQMASERVILEGTRNELQRTRERLSQEVDRRAEKAAMMVTWDRFKDFLAPGLRDQMAVNLGKDNVAILDELSQQGSSLSAWQLALRRRPLEMLFFAVFALIVVAGPLFLNWIGNMWVLPGAVISAVTFVAAKGRVFLDWMEALEMLRGEFSSDLQIKRAALVSGETEFSEDDEITILRNQIADLEGKVQQQEQRVGLTADYVSLYDFVRSRVEDRFYERRLGLMHRVQRDLQELTDALVIKDRDSHRKRKQTLFPRGQARVVLYIDDLDRCPPKRVVEVLEAVQLLLKTELFIVVLGLDTRYVTRALEKCYEGILQAQGSPSGLDYIEKILQIPYRVRPVQPEAVGDFLASQMEILVTSHVASESGPVDGGETPPPAQDGEPSPHRVAERVDLPPAVIAFEQDEYNAIVTTCERVELSARNLKRIANVMKLVKIYWHRIGNLHHLDETRTVVSLLALSARYPEVMRDAFDELEAIHRLGTADEAVLEQSYRSFFAHYIEQHVTSNQYLMRHRAEVEADIMALIPENITLYSLGRRSFNLARSFSFVGDPAASYVPPQRIELIDNQASVLPTER